MADETAETKVPIQDAFDLMADTVKKYVDDGEAELRAEFKAADARIRAAIRKLRADIAEAKAAR